MKQNFIKLISVFFMLQVATNLQAAQAAQIARIAEVVKALSKRAVHHQPPPAPAPVPKTVVPKLAVKAVAEDNDADRRELEDARSQRLEEAWRAKDAANKIARAARDEMERQKREEEADSLRLVQEFEEEETAKLAQAKALQAEQDRKLKEEQAPREKDVSIEQARRETQPCAMKVVNIPVLDQNRHEWPAGNVVPGLSWQQVAQGEGGNCGYHALKNVLMLMGILGESRILTQKDQASVAMLAAFAPYQTFMMWAVPIIAELNVRRDDLSWLDARQLQALVNDRKYPVLVVEEIQQLKTEGVEKIQAFGFTENILLALRQFVQNDRGMLGIIWAAGIQGARSHWVGFVAVKTFDVDGCKIQLYVMNSMSGSASQYTQALTNLLSLTSNNLNEMLREEELKHMQRDVDRLQDLMEIATQGLTNHKVFTRFVGCLNVDGEYPLTFTDILKNQRFLDRAYIPSVNENWNLIYSQINPTVRNVKKNRTYGFWINPVLNTACAFRGEDFKDCASMYEKCKDVWLVLKNDGSVQRVQSIKIQDLIVVLLNDWKNYVVPEAIQYLMLDWLRSSFVQANNPERKILRDNFNQILAKLDLVKDELRTLIAPS